MFNKNAAWFYWLAITTGIIVYLLMQLNGDDKTVFLPGKTSHGHHQIEMACSACHTDPYGGKEVLQDACMSCHAQELKQADDSHPKSKFTDPRNADRVFRLDARVCMTCHVEHKQEITHEMGVTLPENFCFKCHADIAEERPSHTGMSFISCATGGCHNFHDNRALYEDFLAKHLDEPAVLASASVLNKSDLEQYITAANYPIKKYPVKKLDISDNNAPLKIVDDKISQDWLETAHSAAGVNCTACHIENNGDNRSDWIDKPNQKVCSTCHSLETQGFLSGKHGMRLQQGLSAMTPKSARIDMKTTAHDKELSCVSCHSAHRFDVKHAAVQSCLECHNDSHSLSYEKSKHFSLWHKEVNGNGETNSGVSCATCHLPRTPHKKGGVKTVVVQHNQNDNLRPNEKMLRSVCMSCHGLGFSIDALADPVLVKGNFSSVPAVHIESMDLVRKRIDEKGK